MTDSVTDQVMVGAVFFSAVAQAENNMKERPKNDRFQLQVGNVRDYAIFWLDPERRVTGSDPAVFVVDHKSPVRSALLRLIQSRGLQARTLDSLQEFLRTPRPNSPACLVLEIQMPERTGRELRQELRQVKTILPIIFTTGHRKLPMPVHVLKAGAVEFLTKPFAASDLLEGIRRACKLSEAARQRQVEISGLQRRYRSLTPREEQVFALVTRGLLNKQVAAHLGVREKTIKSHRHQVMQKMLAQSVVDLARMADKLSVTVRSSQKTARTPVDTP